MKIVGVRWTKIVNLLLIECSCGHKFEHRADRWNVECPECHKNEHLAKLRECRKVMEVGL